MARTHTQADQFREEEAILDRFGRHQFLCNVRFSFQSYEKIHLVLDYCSGGDLLSLILDRGQLSDSAALLYTTELATALAFLHQHSIVHRDIKLENVLIDKEGGSGVC